ncbi:MAG: nucleotidyltransferase domain-containing protein [Limisphaerales bacterium]
MNTNKNEKPRMSALELKEAADRGLKCRLPTLLKARDGRTLRIQAEAVLLGRIDENTVPESLPYLRLYNVDSEEKSEGDVLKIVDPEIFAAMRTLQRDDELVKEILSWSENKPVKRIWIYGSYLKGKIDYSDIDVAIELNLPTPEENRRFWFENIESYNADLQYLTGQNIHVQLFNPPETPTVCSGVEECSVLLMDRKS